MATDGSKGPAEGKREKISKAQQYTMLEVLGASLVLGTCIVMSIFLIKYIKFNATIIVKRTMRLWIMTRRFGMWVSV